MTLLFWLFTKHFVCDFPLQVFPYMYKNKGTYGHEGGLLHAGIHGLGTLWAVYLSGVPVLPYCILLPALDMVLHYHIDWAKMNLNAIYGWTPTTSEEFWVLLGFDQYLHALTYFFLVWVTP